jgi:serine/threonine-protein kinase
MKELGRGAMGVVYQAIDPNIGRDVAIKTIRLGEVQKPDERERLRERLFREARSAGRLSHPGIVTIYDVDEENDLAYIAMEFVDGPTLDCVLGQEEAISPRQMLSVLGQTAAALDYAHSKGIIHRDIKPANIMIAADGATKVTDFGIAKVTTNEHLTITGTIVGTPHYMSPEQVQGLEVDGRSDQFSLAVIAYEMLTGEKPYTGEHLTTVVYKIVAEEAPLPHRLNATLAGEIENVLRKGMAKKPEGRFENCQEFAAALDRACALTAGWKTMRRGGSLSGPTVAEMAPAVAVSLPPPHRTRLADDTTTERAAGKRPGFFAFLMAILVATGLLALLGWQAGPWLGKTAGSDSAAQIKKQAEVKQPAPQPPSVQPPAEQPAAPQAPAPATPDATAAAPAPAPSTSQPAPPSDKPSPLPPAEPPEAAPKIGAEKAAGAPARPAQHPITIISSPGGAMVTLDGHGRDSCIAPCSVNAAPGRHELAVTMPGYQIERREVEIGTGGIELPPVILRAITGTLMVTSEPTGATILVNGKRLTQVTPAQLSLAPGSYNVTVEKDGKQGSRAIDVHGDAINYMKVTLN